MMGKDMYDEKGRKIKSDKKENYSLVEEEKEEFTTFFIGEERFGVDILLVRDILGLPMITPVPKSMVFIKGVINLRGNIVPVIDLRTKFMIEEREYDAQTVVIVVEVKERSIGMIVDSVSDVVEIDTESIHESPHYSANIQEDFIDRIGRLENDEIVIILDVGRILGGSSVEMRAEVS